MASLSDLRKAKNDAELEMAKARTVLSEAQSLFAAAKKKHVQAQDAFLKEAEKQ